MSREAKFDLLIRTFVVYGLDIPCRLVCWACCLYVTYGLFLFSCLNVGGCLSCSQGFSLNCSLFRAHLCWGGGSVAFEGIVLYCRRGLYFVTKCCVTC